jgi:hypothetical protein
MRRKTAFLLALLTAAIVVAMAAGFAFLQAPLPA